MKTESVAGTPFCECGKKDIVDDAIHRICPYCRRPRKDAYLNSLEPTEQFTTLIFNDNQLRLRMRELIEDCKMTREKAFLAAVIEVAKKELGSNQLGRET